jgi:hypothetical protein
VEEVMKNPMAFEVARFVDVYCADRYKNVGGDRYCFGSINANSSCVILGAIFNRGARREVGGSAEKLPMLVTLFG